MLVVIAGLLAQREAAQASVRYARAQGAPTVNLTHAKSTTPGLAEGQFVTQLQLNVPLIDGGSARGAVGAASADCASSVCKMASRPLTVCSVQLSASTSRQ